MFTKRIIPCLDVHNGRVVKGVNFVNLRDAGDPVEIAAAYDKAGADEIVFLDITASSGCTKDCGRHGAQSSRKRIYSIYRRWRNPNCGGLQGIAAGRGR